MEIAFRGVGHTYVCGGNGGGFMLFSESIVLKVVVANCGGFINVITILYNLKIGCWNIESVEKANNIQFGGILNIR